MFKILAGERCVLAAVFPAPGDETYGDGAEKFSGVQAVRDLG